MPPARYPAAEWLGNGQSGGTYVGKPWRVVLHTTETAGLPSYGGGSTAPHLTWDPWANRWWQHTDLTVASRALKNLTGGVQTNRNNAIQIEMIGYSADHQPWIGNLTRGQLNPLRDFLAWVKTNFGLVMKWPGRQALSATEANTPGFRMSNDVWDRFNGICGHQHVPENTHWDPGGFPWDRLFGKEDMPGLNFVTMDDQGQVIEVWQRILNELGETLPTDGQPSDAMQLAVRRQTGVYVTGKGLIGPTELVILLRKLAPQVALPETIQVAIPPIVAEGHLGS